MGFVMASPWSHPKTGIYWFRRATPRDLMEARGRLKALGIKVMRETSVTLETRDPGEAQAQWCKVNVACMERWEAWRRLLAEGPKRLSQKEMFALSTRIGEGVLDKNQENPGDPEHLTRLLDGARQVAADPQPDEFAYLRKIVRRVFPAVSGHVATDEGSLDKLTRQFLNDAPGILGELHGRASRGDYRQGEWRKGRPGYKENDQRRPVSIETLFQQWERETNPAPKTVQTYRGRIKSFSRILGHDDFSQVTPDDVQRWKTGMLADGSLSGETINDRLGALSALLGWGKANLLLTTNAAAEVAKVRRKKGGQKPRRGYTDNEARKVLVAARSEAGIRRWGPWLCAYTGARIGEVARLRPADVRPDPECEGRWLIEFTQAAGRLKTASGERTIPAHQALLAEGLAALIGSCTGDRLFPELYGPRRDGSEPSSDDVAQRATNAISRWIKSEGVGLSDVRLAPSHAWRHTFKTWCRNSGVDQEGRDAIQGHVSAGVAPDYGMWTVKAMRVQMEKVVALKLD